MLMHLLEWLWQCVLWSLRTIFTRRIYGFFIYSFIYRKTVYKL